MMTVDKAYEILGISPDATDEELKKAYKKQAIATHPDTHPNDPYATVKFQLLQDAKAKIDEARKNSHNNAHSKHQSQSYEQKSSSQNAYSSHKYSYDNKEKTNRSNSYQTEQSEFAKKRSDALKILNEIYRQIKKGKYRNIEKNDLYREIAYKCAYGTLLRHALECILHDKAKEIHIVTEGRSNDELLTFIIDNYRFDAETKKSFYDAKLITNKLTHIEHFIGSEKTFESCQEFYNKKFKKIIESHLASTKKKKSYLLKVYDQLENFSLKNRITNTLLLGNLMRQLLECIVDLWIYNEGLVYEERANVKDKLDLLKTSMQNTGNKQTYFSYSSLYNLHSIRKAVNQVMHVSPNNKMNILKIRYNLLTQTNELDVEIEIPTGEHSLITKRIFSWENILLWIVFFPILIPISIGKSGMGKFKKFILINLSICLITLPIISGLSGLPKFIKEKTSTVITIDVEEMSNQLISGYNNYGYFKENEYVETINIEDDEYIITIKKNHIDKDGTYFALMANKNGSHIGKALIKATHPQYLCNGSIVNYKIYTPIDGHYRIELTNSDVSVKALDKTETSDLEFYATKVAQINNDSLDKMKVQADYVHKANIANWTSPDTCKGAKFVGTYLLSAKKPEKEKAKNILYLIYKINVVTETNSFSYYWYLKYNNVAVLPDGSTTIDYQDYEVPKARYSFTSLTGEGFLKDDLCYEGYERLDDLYSNCVTKILDKYTCEKSVF